jgi:hypothetical protein
VCFFLVSFHSAYVTAEATIVFSNGSSTTLDRKNGIILHVAAQQGKIDRRRILRMPWVVGSGTLQALILVLNIFRSVSVMCSSRLNPRGATSPVHVVMCSANRLPFFFPVGESLRGGTRDRAS